MPHNETLSDFPVKHILQQQQQQKEIPRTLSYIKKSPTNVRPHPSSMEYKINAGQTLLKQNWKKFYNIKEIQRLQHCVSGWSQIRWKWLHQIWGGLQIILEQENLNREKWIWHRFAVRNGLLLSIVITNTSKSTRIPGWTQEPNIGISSKTLSFDSMICQTFLTQEWWDEPTLVLTMLHLSPLPHYEWGRE